MFLAILAILFVGCATKKRPAKSRVPMRPLSQADVDQLRAWSALRTVETQERWKRDLGLECPQGGRENVIISPELGRHAFRVGGNRAARFFFARYMGLVETSNRYDETVDISGNARPVVYNMCPHGTITLVAVLGFEAGIVGGANSYSSQDFVWTARRVVDGKFYYGVSERMSLYIYQWEKEKVAHWVMEVDRVDRPLP